MSPEERNIDTMRDLLYARLEAMRLEEGAVGEVGEEEFHLPDFPNADEPEKAMRKQELANLEARRDADNERRRFFYTSALLHPRHQGVCIKARETSSSISDLGLTSYYRGYSQKYGSVWNLPCQCCQ